MNRAGALTIAFAHLREANTLNRLADIFWNAPHPMKHFPASRSLSLFSLWWGLMGAAAAAGAPADATPEMAPAAAAVAARPAGANARAPAPAFSRPVVVARSAAGTPVQAQLSDFASYADAQGAATVEEVAQLAARQPAAFKATAGYYSGGYGLGAKWLKFTVTAPPGEWWVVILPPFLDDLRFYEPSAGGWIEHRAGDTLPFGLRETPYRGFAFRLHLDNGDAGPRTCFLRLQTTSTNQLLPRLLSGEQFHQTMLIEYVAMLGLVGFLLMMAALNLVSYLPLRDRIHLLFVFALLIQAALYLTNGGFTAQLFLGDYPGLTNAAVGVLSMLAFSIIGPFYIELLSITPQQRLIYYTYRSLQWGAWLALPLAWTNYYPIGAQVVQYLFVASVVLSVPHVVGLWRQAVPGRNQIAGVVVFNMSGLLVHMLSQLGVLPVSMLTLHAAPLSSFGTIAMAHLALVARHNNLQAAHIRAERDAAREREMRLQMEKFIDVVSHEYRNPLAVLSGNLELLNVSHDEAQLHTRTQRMSAAIDRLAAIFNRPLRAGEWGGLRRMEFAPLELEGFLRLWLGRPGAPWHEGAGGLKWESAGPVHILADTLLLETVLGNVLENACKYATPGTPIGVTLTGDAGRANITVSNAVPSTVRLDSAALFERSFRGANSQGIAGTGMGLYLVKKLVSDLRGEVVLDLSLPGRFVLVLDFPSEPPASVA